MAGNTAPAAGTSVTFLVDTTAPTINISAPSQSFFIIIRRPPRSTPFPYTTLCRSTLAPANITLNPTGTATANVGVSGSGNTRTVTLSSLTGDGNLGISDASGTR